MKLTDALAPAGNSAFGARQREGERIQSLACLVEQHHKEVAAKALAEVRVDIDHLEMKQVPRAGSVLLRADVNLRLRRRSPREGWRGAGHQTTSDEQLRPTLHDALPEDTDSTIACPFDPQPDRYRSRHPISLYSHSWVPFRDCPVNVG
jgi:hypothetical protein